MSIIYEDACSLNRIKHLKHGFFARNGGVSSGIYSSLNCSYKVFDDKKNVEKNYVLALHHLGLDEHELFLPNICHSNKAVMADEYSAHEISSMNCDALITTKSKRALAITYADCLPILVAGYDKKFVAAIHAGWRGLKKGIIEQTLKLIRKEIAPKKIICAIGPAISMDGFFVDMDVGEYFLNNYKNYTECRHDKIHIDLRGIAYNKLTKQKVLDVMLIGGNTDKNEPKYFSYRAQNGQTGRHVAIISLL